MIAFKNGEMEFYLDNEADTIHIIKLQSSTASIWNHKFNQFFKESLSAIFGTAAILWKHSTNKDCTYFDLYYYSIGIQ